MEDVLHGLWDFWRRREDAIHAPWRNDTVESAEFLGRGRRFISDPEDFPVVVLVKMANKDILRLSARSEDVWRFLGMVTDETDLPLDLSDFFRQSKGLLDALKG